MSERRERDRILRWALRAFLTLAGIGTVGGFSQFYLTMKLYQKVQAAEARDLAEAEAASVRRRNFETFRSQLGDSLILRDGEIALIKRRLLQLEAHADRQLALERATRDRAEQR